MHVTDCVSAMCHVMEHAENGPIYTYNLGTRTTPSVDEIAATVADVLDVDPTRESDAAVRRAAGELARELE